MLDFDVNIDHWNVHLVSYTNQFGMSDLMIKKIRAGRRSSTVMASAVSGKIYESVKESKENKIGTKLVNTVNTSEQVITLQYHSKVSYHLSRRELISREPLTRIFYNKLQAVSLR